MKNTFFELLSNLPFFCRSTPPLKYTNRHIIYSRSQWVDFWRLKKFKIEKNWREEEKNQRTSLRNNGRCEICTLLDFQTRWRVVQTQRSESAKMRKLMKLFISRQEKIQNRIVLIISVLTRDSCPIVFYDGRMNQKIYIHIYIYRQYKFGSIKLNCSQYCII